MRPSLLVLLAALTPLALPAAADKPQAAFLVVSQSAAVVAAHAGDGSATVRLGLDKAPAAVIVDAKGTTAYVSQPELGTVSVVDLPGLTRRGTIEVGGQPFGLAVTPTDRLLVTDWSGNRLVEVGPEGAASRSVAVGGAPSAVIVSRDGRRAYTVDRESDALSIVDLETFTVTGGIDVGRAPFAAALAPDGRRLFVANVQSGDLSVIDLAFDQEIARIPIGGMPYGVAVDPKGKVVAVTDQEGGRLVLIGARSLAIDAVITVGDYPEGIAALPGAGVFAVANWFSDTLSLVAFDGSSVTHVPAAQGPRMLAALPAAKE